MDFIIKTYFDNDNFPNFPNSYDFPYFDGVWCERHEDISGKLDYIINRLKKGDTLYSIFIVNGKPTKISKIYMIMNNKEFWGYNLSLGKPIEIIEEWKTAEIFRLEKDYQYVHPKIMDFIVDIESEEFKGHIYEFKKAEYDNFLKKNSIVYPILKADSMVNYEEIKKELFISESKRKKIHDSLKYKKNIILQGPPGVGKTYIAKQLAYLTMPYKDTNRVQMIQFHQSYSYEDFIQGYKPEPNGGFKLKNGVFYNFCKRAQADPEYNYFFIIDEINRGNLSKIFGELMMLIEADKRGPEFAIPLTYSEEQEIFYIPKNLYLIGLMNTADRSLAVIDYALRRRFAFVNMDPELGSKFEVYLCDKGVPQDLVTFISNQINKLNELIAEDFSLGKGFLIGHSYFCSSINSENPIEWYNNIIENELGPLLEEYWYDEPIKAANEIEKLFYKE